MTSLANYILALLLGSGLGSSPHLWADTSKLQYVPATEIMEQQYVMLTNRDREALGLSPLSVNPVLTDVARMHSAEMAEQGYFDHISPTLDQRTPMQRYLHEIRRIPIRAGIAENLYYCSIAGLERGHKAFMNSEPHRRNIVDTRYEEMGVGCYVGRNGELYVTELFLYQRFGMTMSVVSTGADNL